MAYLKRTKKAVNAFLLFTLILFFITFHSIASNISSVNKIKGAPLKKQNSLAPKRIKKTTFKIHSYHSNKTNNSTALNNNPNSNPNSLTAATGYKVRYKVTLIEPTVDFEKSRSMGINNSGQIIGRFYNWDDLTETPRDDRAFLWDPENGISILTSLDGRSGTWDLNDSGFVSGWSFNSSGFERAVRWDSSGETIIDIGAFTNTNPDPHLVGNSSSAYRLNNLGFVVGLADIPNDDNTFIPYHAFLYEDAMGIADLGTLTTAYPEWQNGYSIAYDITSNSTVVGTAHSHDGYNWSLLPFIYTVADGMQPLSINPAYSDTSYEWYAVAINESGLIGGMVITDTNRRPHYWSDASSTAVEIALPAQFPNGEVYAVNEQGQMVGDMYESDDADALEHAFLFDIENGLRDLNDLIPPNSGWVLNYALDINDNGQIVGFGNFNGEERGFLLDPEIFTNFVHPSVYMLLLRE